ncbi:MAG: thioredoxin-disulfide reductase [Candidatus Anstonellales archaeon]
MFTLPSKSRKKEYELIIVGGGPAGLSAAIYAARAGLDVLVLEKGVFGGQISNTNNVENYPGIESIKGSELAERFAEHAKKAGAELRNFVEVKNAKKEGGWVVLETSAGELKAKAVIIATGEKEKMLNVPGEKELKGKGISYCATCDGPFFKDKEVMVVGGGNSAIEEANYLTNFAKKVYVVYRKNKDNLKAEKVLIDRAFANKKIEFIFNTETREIRGKEKVESVILLDKEKNKSYEKKIDGVFIYIGMEPNSEPFKKIVKTDEHGYIITDDSLMAGEGIFAAGDVRKNRIKQVVWAAGEGALAAVSAYRYVRGASQ